MEFLGDSTVADIHLDFAPAAASPMTHFGTKCQRHG